MRIQLYNGIRKEFFQFDPEGYNWNKEKDEFLIGIKTGLPAPLDTVFVKRRRGAHAPAHDLLVKFAGQTLPGSPKFFGYAEYQQNHLYFFYNIPAQYTRLEDELVTTDIISPEIVLAVVNQARNLFHFIFQHGFVYIDFCTRNIMFNRAENQIAIIDLDSAWSIPRFKAQPPRNEAGIEFWGLWDQDIRTVVSGTLENAHKTLVLSFAAVWSRAIALAHHPTEKDFVAAINLVNNPSYPSQQRALWDALRRENQYDFLEYFMLDSNSSASAYNQWQDVFNALRSGRIVFWQEIIGAVEKLLSAIRETQKPPDKPGGRRAGSVKIQNQAKPKKGRWQEGAVAPAPNPRGTRS